MDLTVISDSDFARFQQLIHARTGIHFSPVKKSLLCGRLAKRLRQRGVATYAAYYDLLRLEGEGGELEICINLITTNETSFFREPHHFDHLATHILPTLARGAPVRGWSAACSSGEEPYTLALVLADALGMGRDWEMFASDISTAVLQTAVNGVYPLAAAERVPQGLLQRYCLKGVGEQAGTFLIDQPLRSRVTFARVNLNATLPEIGPFDFIFLRNVMIYFPVEVKRGVVARLAARLKPGGHLFIGHSETLNGVTDVLQPVMPTVYRKPLQP